jgi:rfaE bifunctional protein nucleotidyltransferase chain/domain
MSAVLSLENLAGEAARLRSEGRRLVLTNGCFDILHAGHVDYLERARALGDALAVAINSDGSVSELKGPGRPVNSEGDRARVVSALRAVDYVVVFDSLRATEVIRALHPDFYAKGGDYTPDSLNTDELSALREAGTDIRILPLVPGRSTTAILARANAPIENRKSKIENS